MRCRRSWSCEARAGKVGEHRRRKAHEMERMGQRAEAHKKENE